MDGIIFESPYDKLILSGEKKYDFRKKKPPKDKLGIPLYLIHNEKALGEIMISACKYNQIKHLYCWSIMLLKKYPNPFKCKSKSIELSEWANEVELF